MLPRVQRNERIRDEQREHAGDCPERPSTRLRYRWKIRGHEDGNDVNDVNDVNDDVNDDRARQKSLLLRTFSSQYDEEDKVSQRVLLSLDTRT